MCGIVGICEPDPEQRVDESLLVRATRALAHRGPDAEGFLSRGPVSFGFRRLSIIDLEGGSQPIFNEDGKIAVVFNGEIYNYKELRAELEQSGHRFTTSSDTEVIVHAYEEQGPDCVKRLTGMFAFAVWDGRDQSVFVARDHLGVKPLFYHHHSGRLVFASELKAIVQDPSIPRELNLHALDDYLAYSYVPSDRSILQRVQKLPPGHWMLWRAGRLKVERYWDVEFTPAPARAEEEWAERIEAALRKSVRLQLRADVPLGIFLSGGLDSSTITALASQELGARVKTFTVGFREKDFDEKRFARQTAERYATEHHEIELEHQDVSIIEDLAYYLDEPFGDPSALPTYYVCRAAAGHVKVCLSGDGSDETFAGYSRYRIARAYRLYDWLPAPLRVALGKLGRAAIPDYAWGRGELERLASSGASRYLLQMSEFSPAERAELLGSWPGVVNAGARRFEEYFADHHEDLVSILQHIDQKNYLPDDILVKVDRMSMQNSLEVRVPYLDHHLVEAMNAAPAHLKLRGRTSKYLLRKIIAPHLPPEILRRRKTGFGIPIKHWFRSDPDDYARELLLSRESRAVRFLDRAFIERIIRQHSIGMRDFSRKIWLLLMFEQWCRRYKI